MSEIQFDIVRAIQHNVVVPTVKATVYLLSGCSFGVFLGWLNIDDFAQCLILQAMRLLQRLR